MSGIVAPTKPEKSRKKGKSAAGAIAGAPPLEQTRVVSHRSQKSSPRQGECLSDWSHAS
ncbi:MAG: hypothetical protein NW220_10190 [Leptolyngbyaceae cyanobacterium bins.349]|nr:hypothetical protein [Leptolyngbyaceae cyanobacterium bins.349]